MKLTRSQHSDVMDKLFEIESTVRILRNNCIDKGGDVGGSQDLLDVGNVLASVQDRLSTIIPVLNQ